MEIKGFKGENRWLSNFWPCIVHIHGEEFPSVEHAYVAAKADTQVEWLDALSMRDKSAAEVKKFGRKLKPEDWDKRKYEVMYKLVAQKFSFKNPELLQKLLDTKDAYIEETNYWKDTYWGVCNGVGENNLGKIIMEVRGSNGKTSI
jgi:ribA/ribD-fused uncharacterized protein